ncbi:hypothetical protein MAMMFC1_03284 [Methylomusa anaerophila]|uniref:Uncharacterized protein n=1 Tax=Methylomusa anaerophila TaxID=1930071 RepID=A0A348ANE1_9FIRM|nr:hypothetical protein MAMMFC1_03284 [Methylomusa anaerophila]
MGKMSFPDKPSHGELFQTRTLHVWQDAANFLKVGLLIFMKFFLVLEGKIMQFKESLY